MPPYPFFTEIGLHSIKQFPGICVADEAICKEIFPSICFLKIRLFDGCFSIKSIKFWSKGKFFNFFSSKIMLSKGLFFSKNSFKWSVTLLLYEFLSSIYKAPLIYKCCSFWPYNKISSLSPPSDSFISLNSSLLIFK